MKSERECMHIVNAYLELGSYRAAAQACGVSDKTVKAVMGRHGAGTLGRPRAALERAKNTDGFEQLVWDKLERSRGRISAKRLLPVARTAGYEGSARNFRRLVSRVRAKWHQGERIMRPWVPAPAEHLVIDWGEEGPLKIFCAVMAWSRYRFVRFATDQKRETTLRLLAECFEEIGGVPLVVLSDRMGCLRSGTVANVVVPHPDYVRFATHFGFRPDFCEAADPRSKGVVEALVRYAKSDLLMMIDEQHDLDARNVIAKKWCAEVNSNVHSEICAIPDQRLAEEVKLLRPLPSLRPPLRRGEMRKVDRLSTVRFGSARYSVPVKHIGASVEVTAERREIVIRVRDDEIARHPIVAPGEGSITDSHYGGARQAPARAVRPRTTTEKSFLELGEPAEIFLRVAAAAGTPRLEAELTQIVSMRASWGSQALTQALVTATTFRRFTAQDLRSILEAGVVPSIVPAGDDLDIDVVAVQSRPLDAYALESLR